jgi:hypothetical protein
LEKIAKYNGKLKKLRERERKRKREIIKKYDLRK